MRQVNECRRGRVLLIFQQLDKLATARRDLITQLNGLDRQTGELQHEYNALHNLDAPISLLPDEILAMVFEAAKPVKEERSSHFGSLLCRITHRWRGVALATPTLWVDIWFTQPRSFNPQARRSLNITTSENWRNGPSMFLSRSKWAPINIRILHFMNDDYTPEFLQLLSVHMGHCRQLHIKYGDHSGLEKVLDHVSLRPAPLLRSMTLDADAQRIRLHGVLFPSGLPQLRTVQLHVHDAGCLRFCAPSFTLVTSLRLSFVLMISPGLAYTAFWECLTAMKSLNHLELIIIDYAAESSHLPVILPNLHTLSISSSSDRLGDIVLSIQAASLIALSITHFYPERRLELAQIPDNKFPLLQHLIIGDAKTVIPHSNSLSFKFPHLKRITCKFFRASHSCDIEGILTSIRPE
ncbi:hypothetical protein HWV62_27176 [Athelia sp. TMB]|nr:hypothetical protein HWV62_27176 [Athelia sp. TMB]